MKISECYREQRTSSKSGKPYQVLVIVFENGYMMETFLSMEQQFILATVPLK